MSIKDQLNRLKQADIAALFGVNVRTIQRWHDEGLPRHGEGIGAVYVWEEVRAWEKARMSQTGGSDPKERKATAEAEMLEMDLAARRGETVSSHDHHSRLVSMVLTARARFLALPNRLRGDLGAEGAAEVDKAIREVLTDMAKGTQAEDAA